MENFQNMSSAKCNKVSPKYYNIDTFSL